jgi:hypothetical protein
LRSAGGATCSTPIWASSPIRPKRGAPRARNHDRHRAAAGPG